jgi:hypothetical protein
LDLILATIRNQYPSDLSNKDSAFNKYVESIATGIYNPDEDLKTNALAISAAIYMDSEELSNIAEELNRI